jgi:preprotein translocase subunit SecA
MEGDALAPAALHEALRRLMFYPERELPRESALDRALVAARYFAGGLRTRRHRLWRIVSATPAHASLTVEELRARLRREGFTEQLAGEAFALVRAAAERTLSMRHFDVQLVGGWALLQGMIAEMDTGEGKTLTATLAAATAALAGHAVHVITVNEYLADRDARQLRPLYESLGLTVGCVVHGLDPEARRAAYRCDITYCSNKEIAFDYLRDRVALGGRPRPLAQRIAALAGGDGGQRLLLRGLGFAIIDEADSVLIDEARTPLILSSPVDASKEETLYREALRLARQLAPADFRVENAQIELTAAGAERLRALAQPLGGIWSGPRRSARFVCQALAALELYERDKHYLVRDGKVQIIDEYTGRLMPDRSWEQGLHQLIEIKEDCEVTGRRETLARISYQRFFRRYLHLAGMTGTAAEVADEMWAVYRLRVATIPTNRAVRRRRLPDQVFGRAEDKWSATVAAIRERHAAGQPVLVGTRSVAASEHLAALLDAAGLPYRLLNARQDGEEAEIVARAGEPGCITVATNMAGRGTDIKLASGVTARGGLHVICTERHDSGRIDRQLFGRCGRQGDPGSYQAILAAEDDLAVTHAALPASWLARFERLPERTGKLLYWFAQRRAEAAHSRARRSLLDLDDYLGDVLAFAGRGE